MPRNTTPMPMADCIRAALETAASNGKPEPKDPWRDFCWAVASMNKACEDVGRERAFEPMVNSLTGQLEGWLRNDDLFTMNRQQGWL